MALGFWRERNYAVGIFRIGSESPRAFKNHVNVFGRRRPWIGSRLELWLLRLLTRDEEERGQDGAGQRNQRAAR